VPAVGPTPPAEKPRPVVVKKTAASPLPDSAPAQKQSAPPRQALPTAQQSAPAEKPASQPAARPTAPAEQQEEGGPPPPPDAFPPDWSLEELVPNGFVLETQRAVEEMPAVGTPAVAVQPGEAETPPAAVERIEEEEAPVAEPEPEDEESLLEVAAGLPYHPAEALAAAAAAAMAAEPLPPPVKPPAMVQPDPLPPMQHYVDPTRSIEAEEVRMITVVMRPSGDKARDNLRLRQAYGTLISYPGVDRFALLVFERGRGYQIEFPNFTTGLNPELLSRLQRLVGPENVRIETLTFQ